ncbi:MAG: hypothetical protein U0350_26535 [Caldilineaceae bacterium]
MTNLLEMRGCDQDVPQRAALATRHDRGSGSAFLSLRRPPEDHRRGRRKWQRQDNAGLELAGHTLPNAGHLIYRGKDLITMSKTERLQFPPRGSQIFQ